MNFDFKGFIRSTALTIQCHAPEIITVAGLTGMIAATVVACVQTTKVKAVVEKKNEDIKEMSENLTNPSWDWESEEEEKEAKKKETVIIYSKMIGSLVLLYLPAAVLMGASGFAILKSTDILKKRNAALIAAYMALDTSYKGYRKEVTDRYGESVDNDIYNGRTTKKIKKTAEDGTKTTELTSVKTKPSNNPYEKIFDDSTSVYFEKDIDQMKFFLFLREKIANEQLAQQGFLFLNDVLGDLGMAKTQMGQVVGWTYDGDHSKTDGYVSFGIEQIDDFYDPEARCDAAFVLNFNVQGPITDTLIKE